MQVTIAIAFLAGLVSFLSPCVLPLVPAYIGYMSGRVANTVANRMHEPAPLRPVMQLAGHGGAPAASSTLITGVPLGLRLSTLAHGFAFVLGFTLVFVTIGLLGTAFVQEIGRQNINLFTRVIARFGGLLIIFFGLHFMGVLPTLIRALLARARLINHVLFSLAVALIISLYILWASIDVLIALPLLAMFTLWFVAGGAFTQPGIFWERTLTSLMHLLYSDTRRMTGWRGNGLWGSLIMGVTFAAGWTPCIGPIYGAILTMGYAGMEVSRTGILLGAYSLGLGIPFLLAALLMDSAQGILRRVQQHVHTIERVAGAALVVVGVLVITGRLQDLSQQFATQFADTAYRMEACVEQIGMGELAAGEFFACANETEPDDGNTAAS